MWSIVTHINHGNKRLGGVFNYVVKVVDCDNVVHSYTYGCTLNFHERKNVQMARSIVSASL